MKVGTIAGSHVTHSLSEIGNFKSHHSFFPQPSQPPFPTSPSPVPTTKPQEIRQVSNCLPFSADEALLRYIMRLDGTCSTLCVPPLVKGCGPTYEGFWLESRAQDAWGETLTQGTHQVRSKLSCTTWFVSTILSSTIHSICPTAQACYPSLPSLWPVFWGTPTWPHPPFQQGWALRLRAHSASWLITMWYVYLLLTRILPGSSFKYRQDKHPTECFSIYHLNVKHLFSPIHTDHLLHHYSFALIFSLPLY